MRCMTSGVAAGMHRHAWCMVAGCCAPRGQGRGVCFVVDPFMRCLHFAVRMMATPVARSCGHGVTVRSRQRGGWRSVSFRLLASTVFLGTMLSPLGTGTAPAAANSAIQNPVSFRDPIATPDSFTAVLGGHTIDLSWDLNPSGDDVMVAWSTSPVFGIPAGSYSVGDPIAGGGTVLYSGDATAAPHTGLAPGTTYYYTAWSVIAGPAFSAGVACSSSTGISVPYTEDFENGGAIPAGWTQERATGTADWSFEAGGHDGHPAGAHGAATTRSCTTRRSQTTRPGCSLPRSTSGLPPRMRS